MTNYYPGLQFTDCDLHIPHKRWSDNPQEEQNYEAIEQWVTHFRRNCLPKGGGGGTAVVHRVHYDMRNWLHSGSHSSVPSGPQVYGGSELNMADWSNPTGVSEEINPEVFVPDLTSDPSISLLRVTKAGYLTWSGRFWIQIPSAAANSGGKFDFFDDNYSAHASDWGQEYTWHTVVDPLGVGYIGQDLGGGVYVEADTWLEFAVRQNMGDTDGSSGNGAFVGITLTLVEDPGVPSGGGGGSSLGTVSRAVGDSGGISIADNTSFYINWLTNLDATYSYGPAFTPATVNLHVTGRGLITWSGGFRVLSTVLPALGSWVRVTVNDSDQILQENRVPLLCKNFGTGSNQLDQYVAIGGAQYSDLASNSIQISIGLNTGGSATSFNVPFQVAVCHFPWDGGP